MKNINHDILIQKTYEEYLSFFTEKQLKPSDIEKQIEYLYSMGNYKKPKIIILDDPLQCQILANNIMHLGLKTNEIDGRLDELCAKKPNIIYSFESSVVINSWRNGIYSMADYALRYTDFKLDDAIKDQTLLVLDLLHHHIYDLIALDKCCIVSMNPTRFKTDDQHKPHSVEGKAVEFKTGYGLYYIHGVVFDDKLWDMITHRKLTAKQVLQIRNIEQRRVAINHYGMDQIFDELDTTLLSEQTKDVMVYPKTLDGDPSTWHSKLANISETQKITYQLYKAKNIIEDIDMLLVRYTDPSDGRVFVGQVADTNPYDNNKQITTAFDAMAFRSQQSLKEYLEVKREA